MIYTIRGIDYDINATVLSESHIGPVRCIVIAKEQSHPSRELRFTFDQPRQNTPNVDIELYAVHNARTALADYYSLVIAAQSEEHGLGFYKIERGHI